MIATKHGLRVGAGRAKHVVDLDLVVARTGSHEVGAGWAAAPPRGTAGRRSRPGRNRDKIQFLRRAVWVKTLSARLRNEIYRYIC